MIYIIDISHGGADDDSEGVLVRPLAGQDVAAVRVEQLHPWPGEQIAETIAGYPSVEEVVWLQEEPENMGAWRFLKERFGERLLGRFPFDKIARPASASPATGSHNSHRMEQEKLIAAALA